MADIYEIQDSLEAAVEAGREVKEALEQVEDWLADAAAGYSRGGFDATPSQRGVEQDKHDRLVILLEQHVQRQSKLQADYDAALASLSPDDMDDE